MSYFTRISVVGLSAARLAHWLRHGGKVAVQARLKGAGMHWQASHVNPMLALCTAVCNERWEEAWQDTLDEQQA